MHKRKVRIEHAFLLGLNFGCGFMTAVFLFSLVAGLFLAASGIRF